MTAPALAKSRGNNGPRTYAWPPNPPHEFEVISVTSALNALPKPFLLPWAVKMTAERAVDKYEWLGQKLKEEGEKEAIKWLKDARWSSTNEKADRGTIVHAAIEAYVAGKPWSKAEVEAELAERRVPMEMWRSTAGMLAGAIEFLTDKEPEVIWSEATVFNRTHEYAGTADLIGRMSFRGGPPKPVVIDFKTSKSIYSDVAAQLAGYAHAEFVGTPDGTEHPIMPDGEPIETGVVVRPMATGRYEAAAFALTPDVFDLFKACVTLTRLMPALDASRQPGL